MRLNKLVYQNITRRRSRSTISVASMAAVVALVGIADRFNAGVAAMAWSISPIALGNGLLGRLMARALVGTLVAIVLTTRQSRVPATAGLVGSQVPPRSNGSGNHERDRQGHSWGHVSRLSSDLLSGHCCVAS